MMPLRQIESNKKKRVQQFRKVVVNILTSAEAMLGFEMEKKNTIFIVCGLGRRRKEYRLRGSWRRGGGERRGKGGKLSCLPGRPGERGNREGASTWGGGPGGKSATHCYWVYYRALIFGLTKISILQQLYEKIAKNSP